MDGTPNKRGSVKYTTIQKICIKTSANEFHKELSELYVTTLGDHDIILGTNWLHAHNPEVDWALPQLAFTRCPTSCTWSKKPLVITSKKPQTRATTINALNPDNQDHPAPEDAFAQEAMEAFLYNHSFTKYDNLAIQAKTTTSTGLAAKTAPKPTTEHIPAQFSKYSKAFSEHESQHLPQHCPWDHAIELKPGSAMKNCSIYRLTPKETDVLKTYITEHLEKGYIHKSKSPMASPFFFINKKDGKLCPVQDY